MQGVAGVGTPNHESSLTAPEMRPLVLAVLNIPGMDNPPDIMPEELRKLSAALRSADDEVVVRKGIHQRETSIHFTINVSPSFCSNFHVYVTQGPQLNGYTDPFPKIKASGNFAGLAYRISRYNYVPTGITFEDAGHVIVCWPAVFVQNDGHKQPGLPRGRSLSIGNRKPDLGAAQRKEVNLYDGKRDLVIAK
jgi:hypothetical protein